MNVLVIYIEPAQKRKTIEDTIYCYKKYQDKIRVHYYDYKKNPLLLPVLKLYPFDFIIFHNTFVCYMREDETERCIDAFRGCWPNSVKAIFPQDEYLRSTRTKRFIREAGVDFLFTLAFENPTIQKIYPQEEIGRCRIKRTLTGYVDYKDLETIEEIAQEEKIEKTIDIGYRANRTNPSLGECGFIKQQITTKFNETLREYPNIKSDIKNTVGNKNLFLGLDWYRFLLRCRTMVGCMGGASILDPEGEIYKYLLPYKERVYSEKKMEQLLSGFKTKYDMDLDYAMISPRCFECAMTKTCMVLIEGHYNGILKPGIHYIELKKDFSNLDEVLEKVMNKEYCEQMAERTYQDVVLSGRYSYERFVKYVFRTLIKERKEQAKMRVLITGGAGHIGSHITEELLKRGDEVLVIDNYQTGRRDNLTPHENLKIVEDTIANTEMMEREMGAFQPDVIVHAAASYKDPMNWVEDATTNVVGAANLVKAAKENHVKRIIYFQTALCYGLKPIEQPITLTHPYFSGGYSGGSSYAISKTGGELYIELSGIEFISFRLANSYGPRNLSGPLPTFYSRLTTGKECFVNDTRRDFIFVKDLVQVVIKAIDGMGECGYYHISSGKDYAIKELFDATLKALDITLEKDVEVRERGEDDVYTILLDPTKTQKDFAWNVSTPLEEGIKETIEWYKQYGITQTYTHLKGLDK